MKNIVIKIEDFFYGAPILFDIIALLVVWLINIYWYCFCFVVDLNEQIQITSSIIGSTVSLAGFIIAALTIIVTFKSNQGKKQIEDSETALEMLLLSNYNYTQIIRVFKSAIIEMILCCIVLYVAWICSGELKASTIWDLNLSAILVIALALIRSVTILFKLMHLENLKKDE